MVSLPTKPCLGGVDRYTESSTARGAVEEGVWLGWGVKKQEEVSPDWLFRKGLIKKVTLES